MKNPTLALSYALLGFVGLAAEVALSRLLALMMGSSTYAISTMLATYMLGIAVGSLVAGAYLDRIRSERRVLFWISMTLAATVAISPILANILPHLIQPLLRKTYQHGSLFYAALAPISGLILLPPSLLIGASFPVAARWVGTPRAISILYGLNTIGAMAGAWLAGFVLIPAFGITDTITIIALVACAAGLLLLIKDKSIPVGPAAAVILVIFGALSAESMARIDGSVNLMTLCRNRTWAEVRIETGNPTTFRAEGAFGPVLVRTSPDGTRSLIVAGRTESNNREDLGTTVDLALLPIAANPGARSAYVLGLGTGTTVFAARRLGTAVTVVEIEPRVVDAVKARFFPDLFDDTGVSVRIADARTDLIYGTGTFDVFTSELSYPIDPVTAGCYTREFFTLVLGKLNPGGVACQWIPSYLLDRESFLSIASAFSEVFRDVSIWETASGDRLLLGYRNGAVTDEGTLEELLPQAAHFFQTPTAHFIARIPPDDLIEPETDDRPRLEFAAAENMIRRSNALR